jgi:Flp pilus assembly pilin Flp
MLLKLYLKFHELSSREEGQDMVEYALVIALICFGATAATGFLAQGLTTAYGKISTNLNNYTT